MSFIAKMISGKGSGTTVEDVRCCLNRHGKFEVCHEGYLNKQGQVVKNWKKRYFALVATSSHRGVLFYMEDEKCAERMKEYKTQTDSNVDEEAAEKAAKEVGIIGSVVITEKTKLEHLGDYGDKKNVFTVQAPMPSNRVFYLSADTSGETVVWIQKLENTGLFD